ncbi:hypothetical protein N7468_004670 [Penicillium chermesinum]|uniref:HhpF n=2 Tax=Eurotiales TaxID=5042 RepID=A0A7M4CBU1_BYSSP|nr:uncharacterized protein N7468_004670 [Penicillium chermesinum]KAJ5240051.1 hypothetical protein N7468_004670 [Penicillium chermesinum]QOD95010.1 HhpF [Paecilomyces variotii]
MSEMSGLLGKVAGQLSGQKSSQSSNGSSGLMHKMTDTLTGQKHPQDSQNYQATRPYSEEPSALSGYQPGQFIPAESQRYNEPRYQEGHGNYGTPSGGFGGHGDGRGFYPGESTNGHGSHGGYGIPAPHERKYSSHQAGYGGRGASGGHDLGEHRREYPEGGHNAPSSYEGHGEYRGGHNGPVNYAAGHGERGVSHNNSGHGGYGSGHGQYDEAYHGGH